MAQSLTQDKLCLKWKIKLKNQRITYYAETQPILSVDFYLMVFLRVIFLIPFVIPYLCVIYTIFRPLQCLEIIA